MQIDLSPLVSVAIQVLAGLLLACGSAAIAYLAKRLKLANEDSLRAYLGQAVQMGVHYAVSQQNALDAAGKLNVTVKQPVIAAAAAYAISQVPDAVRKLGLDEDSVQRMAEARLSALLQVSAQPVLIPPAAGGAGKL